MARPICNSGQTVYKESYYMVINRITRFDRFIRFFPYFTIGLDGHFLQILLLSFTTLNKVDQLSCLETISLMSTILNILDSQERCGKKLLI